jgi:DNA-binding protein H-NS
MSSYQDLLAQKALLEKQQAELDRALAQARQADRASIIARVRALMNDHGLTLADLGGIYTGKSAHGKSAATGRKVAAKYRNPVTGESWSGRGLKPKWIQAAISVGKKLEDFAV